MSNQWSKAQDWEGHWHQVTATNTYYEEMKQFEYAKKMGIEIYGTPYTPFNFRNYGKIIDIGGGDASMLLKVEGDLSGSVIVDPGKYAKWQELRYKEKGLKFEHIKGEDIDKHFKEKQFDESWIYNCLQHTEDPEKICSNARKVSRLIRIFEWVETPVNEGHIHTLTKDKLDKWLGGYGKVEMMKGNGCFGLAYFGIIPC